MSAPEPAARSLQATPAGGARPLHAGAASSRPRCSLAAVALVTLLLTAFGAGRDAVHATHAGSRARAAPAPGAAAAAGDRDPRRAAARAADRAEPRDGDRLPRRRRRRARARPARPAGERGAARARRAQALRRRQRRAPLLPARRHGADDRRARRRRAAPGRTSTRRSTGRSSASPTTSSTAQPYGVRIDIQPAAAPSLVVSLTHLRPDPGSTVGSTVAARRPRRSARVLDLSPRRAAGARALHAGRGQPRRGRAAPRPHRARRSLKLLFVADVFGAAGRRAVEERLPPLREELDVDVCIVNGENVADGAGITPQLADRLLARGRGRDHARQPRLARGARSRPTSRASTGRAAGEPLAPTRPGRGLTVVPARDGTPVAVINVMGQLFLDIAVEPVRGHRRARRGGARGDAGRRASTSTPRRRARRWRWRAGSTAASPP